MTSRWHQVLVAAVAIAVVAALLATLLQRDPGDARGGGDTDSRVEVIGSESGTADARTVQPVDAPSERTHGAVDAASAAEPRIHGRVVDDATGLPIEGLVVAIGKDAERLETRSDGDGSFAFDADFGRHTFELQLANGARVSFGKSRRKVTADDLPLELRARIGPRYLIEIVGPPEAQEATWTAHLIAHVQIPNAPARETDRVPAQPLEPGDPRVVRFPSRPMPKNGEALWLALRDSTGEWRGEIVAPTLVGEHDEILQIVVERFGVLRGRVARVSGPAVKGATVHLTAAGSRPWPPIDGPWLLDRTQEEGTFEFDGLSPGDYFLRVAPPFLPMTQRRVTVPAGPHDVGTIEVAGGGEPGAVSGVIKSAAGRGGICAILQIESLDGSGWAASTIAGRPGELLALFYGGRPAQPATDELEVAFTFKDVPAGRYRLVVVPWDARRYDPAVLELTAPADDVLIVREDSTPDVEFVFEVTDARTGERIETFMARFHTERWAKEKSFPRRSGEILGRLAPDGDLAWAVFADGYTPAWGDASAFEGSGSPRVHHVALERGWGADFVVRDGQDPRRHHDRAANKLSIPAPGEAPLVGVEVFVDGELVGTTDSEGRLRVTRPAAPARVTFVRPGWVVTPTTTFADGMPLLDCPSPKVWMIPTR